MILTCSGCDKQWTGVNRAHCSACHQTFGGVTSFDSHRKQMPEGKKNICIDPNKLNLILTDKEIWTMQYPE